MALVTGSSTSQGATTPLAVPVRALPAPPNILALALALALAHAPPALPLHMALGVHDSSRKAPIPLLPVPARHCFLASPTC
jgi:hypothetical protein